MNTYPEHLSAEEIAAFYEATQHVPASMSPVDIEDDVFSWFERGGMGHRTQDAFAIAMATVRLARAKADPPHVPTPEEAARLDDLHRSVGGSQQVPDVGSMSMHEFAAARQQLGLGRNNDLVAFLGGSTGR